MNSPAFDAGVMKGDEILTFQGFRGETYRKWIDGIRRLTTDTASGLKIPVIVGRDGKQMTVQIEVPPRERAAATRPLAQPGSPLVQPGVAPQANVAVVGGNNVAIGGSGPFVDFFGGEQAASPHDRAVAQLVRIGRGPTPGQAKGAPAGVPAPAPTAVPAKGGARVGMAGFRDDASGMVVMVDVAGLPSGTYSVSIADPSVLGGAAVAGPNSASPNVAPPAQPTTSPQTPPAGSGQRISPNGSVPPPAKPGQPQGNLQLKPSIEIPQTVLAQVAAPPDPIPTSAPNPADAKTNPGTRPAVPLAAGTGSGTLKNIGTLTVDVNGAGRLQQRVESARVRDVVGEALVIYGQHASPPTATPANPDATSPPPNRPGLNGPISTGNYDQSLQGSNLQVPVAGGIIQLITDRRPRAGLAPPSTRAPGGAGGPVEQPASVPPPANQNLVR
jgi:hypothetical protein